MLSWNLQDMLCEHSYIKRESLAPIRSIIVEIRIFSTGIFIGTPCILL